MCDNEQLKLSRRKFIKLLSAATVAGVGQHVIRATNDVLAFGAVGSGRRAVFIYLGGGASHNLFPLDHGTFRDKMAPGNLYPTSTLAVGNGDQFFHPALVNLHARYQAGQVALMNKVSKAVCYRSHDTDTSLALSGLFNASSSTSTDLGIGARIACQEPSNPLAALSFSGLGTWTEGTCNPPLDIDNIDNLGERPIRWNERGHEYFASIRDNVMAATPTNNGVHANFIRSSMDSVGSTLAAIQGYEAVNPGVTFPNTGLGNALRNVAQIIIGQQNSALKTATFLTSLGGWDTHSGEGAALTNRATELDGAIGAFMNALDANNLTNEVSTVTMTEFNRTFSNGSGTDHGESLAMLAVGGRINGGRYTNAPATPAECAGQYIRAYDIDYRSALGQFVEGAIGVSRNIIFPDPIPFGDVNLNLFRP